MSLPPNVDSSDSANGVERYLRSEAGRRRRQRVQLEERRRREKKGAPLGMMVPLIFVRGTIIHL